MTSPKNEDLQNYNSLGCDKKMSELDLNIYADRKEYEDSPVHVRKFHKTANLGREIAALNSTDYLNAGPLSHFKNLQNSFSLSTTKSNRDSSHERNLTDNYPIFVQPLRQVRKSYTYGAHNTLGALRNSDVLNNSMINDEMEKDDELKLSPSKKDRTLVFPKNFLDDKAPLDTNLPLIAERTIEAPKPKQFEVIEKPAHLEGTQIFRNGGLGFAPGIGFTKNTKAKKSGRKVKNIKIETMFESPMEMDFPKKSDRKIKTSKSTPWTSQRSKWT